MSINRLEIINPATRQWVRHDDLEGLWELIFDCKNLRRLCDHAEAQAMDLYRRALERTGETSCLEPS